MNQYESHDSQRPINKKNTLLIVDDEAVNIHLLLEILQQTYRILIATNGEQALELLTKHHDIDLVLLDVDMPSMSGFEVLNQIRQTPEKKQLPVIMVTARNKGHDEAYGLEQGANDYLSKPISATVVKARVKNQLLLAQTKSALIQKNSDVKIALVETQNAKNELTQFTSMISHELRTPISVLQCEIELLVDRIRKPDQNNLNSLLEEVSHFNGLINDMFELVLSDARTLNYDKSRCQLDQLVHRSIDLFKSQFSQAEITLELQDCTNTSCEDAKPTHIYADPKRIKQVLDNIIKNSLKYTNQGGQLTVNIETCDAGVWGHFQDSAPGLNDAALEKIFDRFFRVEESRNRATGGAGLGLSICKTIMHDHGGRILAKPSPNGGVWISIGFPLAS